MSSNGQRLDLVGAEGVFEGVVAAGMRISLLESRPD